MRTVTALTRRLLPVIVCAVAAAVGRANLRAADAVPVFERSTSNALLTELTEAERKLAAARGAEEISMASQRLAFVLSMMGDSTGAIAAFRPQQGARVGGATGHSEAAQRTLDGYRAVPALEAIVEAARDRQIVMLNEAHHVARHRAFAHLLAVRLREIGFEYLACETFSERLDGLRQRGYPIAGDGYYTREPLFGDFVRQSLQLGFVPIAYESQRPRDARQSVSDAINARETDQAANLVERIFKKNPKARVFIYVGYSHLLKREQNRSGQMVQWMAGRLQTLTGLNPLTIDQVAMTDPAADTLHGTILERVFSGARSEVSAVVLRREEAPRDSLVLGNYQGDANMQVFHRPTQIVRGRPDWLSMEGIRKPQEIPAAVLPQTGRRLVKAFVEGEEGTAIAMDQVIVRAGEPAPVLMLPAGRFRFYYEQ